MPSKTSHNSNEISTSTSTSTASTESTISSEMDHFSKLPPEMKLHIDKFLPLKDVLRLGESSRGNKKVSDVVLMDRYPPTMKNLKLYLFELTDVEMAEMIVKSASGLERTENCVDGKKGYSLNITFPDTSDIARYSRKSNVITNMTSAIIVWSKHSSLCCLADARYDKRTRTFKMDVYFYHKTSNRSRVNWNC